MVIIILGMTAFTNDTGITVQPLSTIPETGTSTSVANRIVSEGAGTPADVLSKLGQTYLRDQTFEYPLIPQVPPSASLVPLDQIQSPDIDLNDIDNSAAVALLTSTNHLS